MVTALYNDAAKPSNAGVVKLADARDSKSRGVYAPCRFDSDLRHHFSWVAPTTAIQRSRGACPQTGPSMGQTWETAGQLAVVLGLAGLLGCAGKLIVAYLKR